MSPWIGISAAFALSALPLFWARELLAIKGFAGVIRFVGAAWFVALVAWFALARSQVSFGEEGGIAAAALLALPLIGFGKFFYELGRASR